MVLHWFQRREAQGVQHLWPLEEWLELLVALLNLGMSVPEICCRKRHDLNLEDRRLLGYKKRSVKLGARAVAVCVALANATPSFHKKSWSWLLG